MFRPLLESTRDDTHGYCLELGLQFRQDSTNHSLRFTRNRIRHELIPALKQYNPRIREALVRIGSAATESQDFLSAELDALWPNLADLEDNAISLDAAALQRLHPALRAMAMRRAYAQVRGNLRRLSETHVKSMLALVEAHAGKRVYLPGGAGMRSESGRLIIAPLDATERTTPTPDFEHPLQMPGVTSTPLGVITIEPAPGVVNPAELWPHAALFDAEEMGDGLVVRNRRPGDRIQMLGMSGRRKLKDLFIDLKIPRHLRQSTPILASEKGVLWIYPYRRSADWESDQEHPQDNA